MPRPLLCPLVLAGECAVEDFTQSFVNYFKPLGRLVFQGLRVPTGQASRWEQAACRSWPVWMLWASLKRSACVLMPRLVQTQLSCTRCALLCAFGRQPLQHVPLSLRHLAGKRQRRSSQNIRG